jgi:CheY-like chemotaxis protein
MAKILVIEDNPVDCEMIKNTLEKNGYQVMVARKGKEGINKALAQDPDLILMDMILPGMHGLEVTIKLKKLPQTEDIPIVALTAVGNTDFIKECYQEGICAFIKKPFEPQDLIRKIEKFIKKQAQVKKKRILIIDHEPDTSTMLTMSLMRHGFQVVSASEGKEGTDQAFKERPDLILLSSQMLKDGDGAFFDKLRKSKETASIPVILMTSQSDPKKTEKEKAEFKAQEYILRPEGTKEAIQKIKKVIG